MKREVLSSVPSSNSWGPGFQNSSLDSTSIHFSKITLLHKVHLFSYFSYAPVKISTAQITTLMKPLHWGLGFNIWTLGGGCKHSSLTLRKKLYSKIEKSRERKEWRMNEQREEEYTISKFLFTSEILPLNSLSVFWFHLFSVGFHCLLLVNSPLLWRCYKDYSAAWYYIIKELGIHF